MAEEQKAPVFDPEALQVDVRLLGTPQGKLIGLATVEYHGFRMDNFKVFNGENGLFLGEPTIRDTRSNGYVKTIHVRGEELRNALNQKALEGYNAAVEKLVARAEGARRAARENAARPATVKAHNRSKDAEL